MIEYKELEGISYVFCFIAGRKYVSCIDMASKDTVENTGKLWCYAAYGNALIFLNNSKVTDALYLMDKEGMENFDFTMSKDEQKEYLKSHAKRIVTREGIQ